MKVVYSFSEFKLAIKAGERDILLKGCSKKLLCAFSAASVCIGMGITSTAGVISSAGIIAAATAAPTGGISTVLIITSAVTIVAIVALCLNYDIEVDWASGDVHVRIKRQ